MTPLSSEAIFLGRQPILDTTHTVIGYELLFRAHGGDETAHFDSAASATAQVICTAFTEFGIAAALRDLKAFVNVDPSFLDSDAVEMLPADQVVLEVAPQANEAMLARYLDLRARGYEFAVGLDPRDPLPAAALLDLASYIKIDVAHATADQVATVAAKLNSHARKLLAAKVETVEQAEWCGQQGFQYFQGYYFARPLIEEGRRLDPTTQGLLRIVNLVSTDVETHSIENAFKGDPALTMNLLRVVNSAAMGLRSPVGSIAQAITLLGRRQLLRWLHLLLFRGSGGSLATNPLMLHAAMRGRMIELLVQRRHPGERAMLDSAFIVGVMSLMPAALRVPMCEVLAQIALSPEVAEAVGDYGGPLGQLLLLIEYYDDNNMLGCELTLVRIGELNQHILNTCLTEALAWVQDLDA
ncbi:MAG: HDOD domain-containing protein [Sulfurisoma sp.]|nr:HDOD domain-containing protein [Sulfurisoma sp.]